MPSDTVLSDEQRSDAYIDGTNAGRDHEGGLLAVERATIAALAAQSEVDVEELAGRILVVLNDRDYCLATELLHRIGDEIGIQAEEGAARDEIADALRLALATVEARHEADETYYDLQRERDALKEREAWWLELVLIRSGGRPELGLDWLERENELRKRLGLEG